LVAWWAPIHPLVLDRLPDVGQPIHMAREQAIKTMVGEVATKPIKWYADGFLLLQESIMLIAISTTKNEDIFQNSRESRRRSW